MNPVRIRSYGTVFPGYRMIGSGVLMLLAPLVAVTPFLYLHPDAWQSPAAYLLAGLVAGGIRIGFLIQKGGGKALPSYRKGVWLQLMFQLLWGWLFLPLPGPSVLIPALIGLVGFLLFLPLPPDPGKFYINPLSIVALFWLLLSPVYGDGFCSTGWPGCMVGRDAFLFPILALGGLALLSPVRALEQATGILLPGLVLFLLDGDLSVSRTLTMVLSALLLRPGRPCLTPGALFLQWGGLLVSILALRFSGYVPGFTDQENFYGLIAVAVILLSDGIVRIRGMTES